MLYTIQQQLGLIYHFLLIHDCVFSNHTCRNGGLFSVKGEENLRGPKGGWRHYLATTLKAELFIHSIIHGDLQ